MILVPSTNGQTYLLIGQSVSFSHYGVWQTNRDTSFYYYRQYSFCKLRLINNYNTYNYNMCSIFVLFSFSLLATSLVK